MSAETPTWPLLALAGVLALGCARGIDPKPPPPPATPMPTPSHTPVVRAIPFQAPQAAPGQTAAVPPSAQASTPGTAPILEATPASTAVPQLTARPGPIHLTSTPVAVAAAAPAPSPTSTPGPPYPTVTIGDTVFRAELVSTPGERARGLSGREALPPGTGMLFIFETGVAPAFWMKEMRFPLDLVWIGNDCTVVDITAKVPIPAPGTPLSMLLNYASRDPAAYTFEINAGEAEQHGITAGARVRFSGLPAEMPAACE